MSETPNYYAIIPADVRYADITPNAKLLYAEITCLTNKEGFCWAGNNYFAKLFNVTNTSISLWVKELFQKKFIRIEMKNGNERNIFLIESPLKNLKEPFKKSYTDPLKNFKAYNINNKKNNKSNIEGKEILPFLSKDFENVWNDFKQHRKLIKSPLTNLATERIFIKLKPYSEAEAIEMLNESILNGWKGVFEVKKFNSNKKPKPFQISNFENQKSGFTDESI